MPEMIKSIPPGSGRVLAGVIAANRIWPQALLLVLVAAAYTSSLFAGFTSDDWAMIVDNQDNLASLAAIPRALTTTVWEFSNVENNDRSLYRPAWLLWHLLIYSVSGEHAFGWHFANLVLHTINAFLLAALIKRLLPKTSAREQYLAAALFAVHPALTQSVAWASGSTDILLTAAFLAGFLSYLRFRETGRGRDLARTALWFGVAVSSKETGLVFPLVVIVHDLSQATARKKLPLHAYAVLFAVAAAYLLARSLALHAVLPAGSNLFQISAEAVSRLAEYALLYGRFLAVPWPVPYYLRHIPEGVAEAYEIGIGAIVVAALMLAVLSRRTRFAVLWMILTLAVPLLLALHDKGHFAVRFLYLPAAGGAVLAGAVLLDLKRQWPRSATLAALGLAVTLAVLTHAETLAWHSQETWARKVIAFDPRAATGWLALGRFHDRRGDGNKAVGSYREGMQRASPASEKVKIAEVLGLRYADERKFAESLDIFRWISEQKSFEAKGLLGVGNNYWMLRRYEDARDAYEQARRFAPTDLLLLYNLGLLSEQLGQAANAAKYYGELLRLAPNWSNTRALARARRYLEATSR
jgi:tetratricopeptide (TPR) repeat protein